MRSDMELHGLRLYQLKKKILDRTMKMYRIKSNLNLKD